MLKILRIVFNETNLRKIYTGKIQNIKHNKNLICELV